MSKYDIAWNNAPEIEGKDAQEIRQCAVCGSELHRHEYCGNGKDKLGWDVEHLNGKQKDDEPTNLRAVHHMCNKTKPKLVFCDAIKKSKE